MLSTYVQGLAVGMSLIIAIGAQNAFVLKQGLKKQFVFWVCFVCALSDSILIVLGVSGFSKVLQHYPEIIQFSKWAGALFLFCYGFQHALRAFKSQQGLEASPIEKHHLVNIILLCLALTWLNPHVYLDTVILLGTIASRVTDKLAFALGAVLSSFIFFFSLGYGARVLQPLFAKPLSWKILDILIGVVMWGIAASLLLAN